MAREYTYLIHIRNLIVITRPRKIRITDGIDFRTVPVPIDLLRRSRSAGLGVGGNNPIEGDEEEGGCRYNRCTSNGVGMHGA